MTEEINGWKPPLVTDLGSGQKRIATQEDIDRLERRSSLLSHIGGSLLRLAVDLEANKFEQWPK